MSEQQTAVEAKPKSKTLILAVAGAAIMAGAGFGAWRFLPPKGSAASKAEAGQHKSAVKAVLHLESFVVNLNGAGPEASGYLRVGIDLGLGVQEEVGEEAKKKGPGPIPIVRDVVLTVLAKAKSEELLTPEGKATLKKELLAAIAERLPELGVVEVFFTEFIVQR
jgi:flagellar FliL protein